MKNQLFVVKVLGGGLILSLTAVLLSGSVYQIWNQLSPWHLLPNLLVSLVLGSIIVFNRHEGLKLVTIVFLVFFVIGNFNILIEAYIFDVTGRRETIRQMLEGFITSCLFAPFLVFLFRHRAIQSYRNIDKAWVPWMWRVVIADFLYLFIYISAGMILTWVYPQMMNFYEDKIPPLGLIVKTQLFVRGFLFIGIAMLMCYAVALSRWKTALLIGVTFGTIGGLAPLIHPNELMPPFVRFGHAIEVFSSNMIYGTILGLMFYRRFNVHEPTSKSVQKRQSDRFELVKRDL